MELEAKKARQRQAKTKQNTPSVAAACEAKKARQGRAIGCGVGECADKDLGAGVFLDALCVLFWKGLSEGSSEDNMISYLKKARTKPRSSCKPSGATSVVPDHGTKAGSGLIE